MNTSPVRRFSRRSPISVLLACLGWLLSITTVVPPKFAELVNESDYIVHAVVKPGTSEWLVKNGQSHIFTHAKLEELEVANSTPAQPLMPEMLGGRVGDEEMVGGAIPKVQVGQEDILFLRGHGRQFFPLTAIRQGRYPVQHEKNGWAYVARSNQVPLQDTAEATLSMAEGKMAGMMLPLISSATEFRSEDKPRFLQFVEPSWTADLSETNFACSGISAAALRYLSLNKSAYRVGLFPAMIAADILLPNWSSGETSLHRGHCDCTIDSSHLNSPSAQISLCWPLRPILPACLGSSIQGANRHQSLPQDAAA